MNPSLFAVTGKPVLHSISPIVFNRAFELLNMNAFYTRLQADSAHDALLTAREIGIRGLNVTAPFKEDMLRFVDKTSAQASEIGAINCVVFEDGASTGYNTDVDGVIGTLRSLDVDWNGKRAIVLGAGGASRAAVLALNRLGAAVTVVNRTFARAKALSRTLACEVVEPHNSKLSDILKEAALVVNTLSCKESIIPEQLIHPHHIILEAQYRQETALARWARAKGALVIDGLEWLLHQAKRSFYLFTAAEFPAEVDYRFLGQLSQEPKATIALIGMMGAGKSSVAQELAKGLDGAVCDIDARVETEGGRPIASLFEEHGEPAFRDLESRVLNDVCMEQPAIISCGGGVVLRRENRELLKHSAFNMWLWAKPSELRARLKDESSRPLLKNGSSLELLLESRIPLYAQVADMIVPTEGRLAAHVAKVITYEASCAREH